MSRGYDLVLDETEEKVYRNGSLFNGVLFLRGPGEGPIWQHIATVQNGAYSHDSEYPLKNWTICSIREDKKPPETRDPGPILIRE